MINFTEIISKNYKNFILLFLSIFILSFIFWVKKFFGSQVYYVEILHNFFSDYDGIKNSPTKYKINFFLFIILPSFFLPFLIIFIVKKLEKYFFALNSYKIIKLFFLNYKVLLFYIIIFFIIKFKFIDYIISYNSYKNHLNLYNNPISINYLNPEIKKNLIIIYYEALEYNVQNFTKNKKDNPLLPINKLSGKNIYDFKHAPTTSFSIAGILSSQCSIPLYPSVGSNISDKEENKIFCLSDVLNKYNYKQYHFMTINKKFHRTDLFLEKHHYLIYDNEEIRKEYPDAKVSWGGGVHDNVMLNFAKKKILELSSLNEPFSVSIKTTDTHEPWDISPLCKSKKVELTKNDIYTLRAFNAYRCTSNFIKKFFDELNEKGVLNNTVIVIMGDHLIHGGTNGGGGAGQLLGLKFNDFNRNIYFKINSEKKFKRSVINHFDVAPTILDEMNFLPFDQKKFGFGVSLFKDNINYKNHSQLVFNKRILSDFYMRNLLKSYNH